MGILDWYDRLSASLCLGQITNYVVIAETVETNDDLGYQYNYSTGNPTSKISERNSRSYLILYPSWAIGSYQRPHTGRIVRLPTYDGGLLFVTCECRQARCCNRVVLAECYSIYSMLRVFPASWNTIVFFSSLWDVGQANITADAKEYCDLHIGRHQPFIVSNLLLVSKWGADSNTSFPDKVQIVLPDSKGYSCRPYWV